MTSVRADSFPPALDEHPSTRPGGRTKRRPSLGLMRAVVREQSRYGSGSGAAFADLNACTPAELSPSNGVVAPAPCPRQKSSPAGSANQTPMLLRSTRVRTPPTTVDENASPTISFRSPWAVPPGSLLTSPCTRRHRTAPRLLEQEDREVGPRRQVVTPDLEMIRHPRGRRSTRPSRSAARPACRRRAAPRRV
jgi:hypothetical protein